MSETLNKKDKSKSLINPRKKGQTSSQQRQQPLRKNLHRKILNSSRKRTILRSFQQRFGN
jgi:hypothetical protein